MTHGTWQQHLATASTGSCNLRSFVPFPAGTKHEVGCRYRPAEQIALHLGATGASQEIELLLGLYAFGSGDDVEALRHADHRAHDGRAISAHEYLFHERPVDLDLVERE